MPEAKTIRICRKGERATTALGSRDILYLFMRVPLNANGTHPSNRLLMAILTVHTKATRWEGQVRNNKMVNRRNRKKTPGSNTTTWTRSKFSSNMYKEICCATRSVTKTFGCEKFLNSAYVNRK